MRDCSGSGLVGHQQWAELWSMEVCGLFVIFQLLIPCVKSCGSHPCCYLPLKVMCYQWLCCNCVRASTWTLHPHERAGGEAATALLQPKQRCQHICRIRAGTPTATAGHKICGGCRCAIVKEHRQYDKLLQQLASRVQQQR